MAIKVLKGGFISIGEAAYNLKKFRSIEKHELSFLEIPHSKEKGKEAKPYMITFTEEPKGNDPGVWNIDFKTQAERDKIYNEIISVLDKLSI